MSDDQQTAATPSTGAVPVPASLRAAHPELVELILHSESMNDEERTYWIEILPLMTEEQIKQLREILHNERSQLAAIDQNYGKKLEQMTDKGRSAEEIAQERRSTNEERQSQEEHARSQEKSAAENILKEME
jgi:hypothetical protein